MVGWTSVCARDDREIETMWANIRLSDQTQVGIGIDITDRKRDEAQRELRGKRVLVVEDEFFLRLELVVAFRRLCDHRAIQRPGTGAYHGGPAASRLISPSLTPISMAKWCIRWQTICWPGAFRSFS
jgi:hypothetical protein